MSQLKSGARTSRNLIALSLLLFSAGLRLYKLDQGLWYDEITSLVRFYHSNWHALLTQMPEPTHHPLYSLLARVCLLLFGEKEWSLRLPAFIFGSLTPPLLYLFGEARLSRRVGILAGLFLAISMWPVWFSQDARGYSAMIFFSLLATHQFFYLREKISGGRVFLYLVSAVLACYSHLYAAAVVFAHLPFGLFPLHSASTRKKALALTGISLLALLLSFLVYLPLLPDLLRYLSSQGHVTSGRSLSVRFLLHLFYSWSGGEGRPLLSLLFLLPAALGFLATLPKDWTVPTAWLLSLAAGLLAPFFLGAFVYHRFYAYALPGFYLLVAAGLDFILRWARLSRLLASLVVAPLVLILGLGLFAYYHSGKQGLKPAVQWLKTHAPDRKPLTLGITGEVLSYYLPQVKALPPRYLLDSTDLSHVAVIISHLWSVGRPNLELLEQRCQRAKVFPSAGYEENEVRVYLCE